MGIHIIENKYAIFKGEKIAEKKFRNELSTLIIKTFGKGPFDDQSTVREIVVYSLNYYIKKFKEICYRETSVRFYQNIFWFHEQATELAIFHAHEDLSPDITSGYIAQYRRILKFILEMGCEVRMVTGEATNLAFKRRTELLLHDLLFLGEMILMCVDLYAEQTMIEDVADVSFDEEGLYVFSRRHHYETIFEHIINETNSHLTQSIVDTKGLENLKNALQNCFGIKYEDVGHLIASIHKQNEPKGGEIVGVGWETLPVNLHNLFNIPIDIAEQFFRGLRLDKSNKMDLLDLACKPYNLNRYLYRPIIIWNIDGNDYAFFGKNTWTEAIFQYAVNAIPWGKAPVEWIANPCFKSYVHEKEDQHDKWLEDEVEKKLKNQQILYDRNIKQLLCSNGNVNIDVAGLGEVDFIIMSPELKKIYIVDCKHLLGRYDMVNQKNDYNVFTGGPRKTKSYNQTMTNKLNWFNQNKNAVEEHFQIKYKNNKLVLDGYAFEGIFIINTPTFYMYNSEYRIYTIVQVEDVISGKFQDPTFIIIIEEDDNEKVLNVKYPYFQKPSYLTFDPFTDDEDGK